MVIVESGSQGAYEDPRRGNSGPRPDHDSRFRPGQERGESHQRDGRDAHPEQMETKGPDPEAEVLMHPRKITRLEKGPDVGRHQHPATP